MISLLMLNVKNVFDNIFHVILFHNFKKRNINEKIIK